MVVSNSFCQAAMESGSADGRCGTETNLLKNRLKAASPPGTEIGEYGQLYSANPCVLLELPCSNRGPLSCAGPDFTSHTDCP